MYQQRTTFFAFCVNSRITKERTATNQIIASQSHLLFIDRLLAPTTCTSTLDGQYQISPLHTVCTCQRGHEIRHFLRLLSIIRKSIPLVALLAIFGDGLVKRLMVCISRYLRGKDDATMPVTHQRLYWSWEINATFNWKSFNLFAIRVCHLTDTQVGYM